MLGVLLAPVARAAAPEPPTIYVLIDTSGSMSLRLDPHENAPQDDATNPVRMNEVRKHLLEFAGEVREGYRVKLSTFNEAPPVERFDRVIRGPADRDALKAAFRGLEQANKGTQLWASLDALLSTVADDAAKDPDYRCWLYVYTDGEDDKTNPRDPTRVFQKYADLTKSERVNIQYFTLLIRLNPDERAKLAALPLRVTELTKPGELPELKPLISAFDLEPARPAAGKPARFIEIASGSVTKYAWDFGDGQTSDQRSPSHTYARPGTYQATLTVTDTLDRSVKATRTVTVVEGDVVTPSGRFAPGQVHPGGPVQFINESTGPVKSVRWSFGDGATSDERNPSKAYDKPGEYAVTLTANADDGTSKPLTLPAKVRVVAWEKPRADFIGPSEATVGEPVSFVDTTAGRVDRRTWTATGAAGGGTQATATFTFPKAGDATVRH